MKRYALHVPLSEQGRKALKDELLAHSELQRFAAMPFEGLVQRHDGEWLRWEDFTAAVDAVLGAE